MHAKYRNEYRCVVIDFGWLDVDVHHHIVFVQFGMDFYFVIVFLEKEKKIKHSVSDNFIRKLDIFDEYVCICVCVHVICCTENLKHTLRKNCLRIYKTATTSFWANCLSVIWYSLRWNNVTNWSRRNNNNKIKKKNKKTFASFKLYDRFNVTWTRWSVAIDLQQ